MSNKIRNSLSIPKLILLIFSTYNVHCLVAQDYSYTKPVLTDKWKDYKQQVLHDSSKRMLELRSLIPGMLYDLRYATKDNFMNRRMYPQKTTTTFLRKDAAEALQKVQQELATKGYGLKIFDAYRPWSVTAKFWELVHDNRYVANPSNGSWHNRGIAVDLTIINLETGKELDMGTGFDNFTDTAHSTFTKLPADILDNRKLFKTTMEKFGFKQLDTEWWHFYIPDATKFEILDIDFKKLNKKL